MPERRRDHGGDDWTSPAEVLKRALEFAADDDSQTERLAADERLVAALRRDGFEGSSWNEFAADLACYGLSVVRVWIAKGQIFNICRSKRLNCGPAIDSRHLTGDAAEELALETVAKAVSAFREVLRSSVWSAAGGASLKTFFLGQCLIQFANVYRRWRREELAPSWAITATLDEHHLAELADDSDMAAMIVDKIRSQMLLDLASDRERAALELLSEGYSYRAIGEVLGGTAKAIENVVQRFRQRIRKQGLGA